MKKSFYFLCTLALTGTLFSCNPTENEPAETDYTKYVNTFIGAADNGHTFPGACRPFGMIQTSPVTGAVGWRYCSEYVNSDSIIWGFTQTHLNGTGCMDLGDVLVMPVTGTRTRAWDAYRSRFSKKQEAATPGYYTVELAERESGTHRHSPRSLASLHLSQCRLCFRPHRLATRTDMERKPISLSGEGMRGELGRRSNPDRACAQQCLGQSGLFLRDEVQPTRHRLPLPAYGRDRKRQTHHCLF